MNSFIFEASLVFKKGCFKGKNLKGYYVEGGRR